MWATSGSATTCSKRSYETLETYGDTILKLAATLFAFEWLSDRDRFGEKETTDLKTAFITNVNLNRIGHLLNIRKYMRTKDPDVKS